MISSRGCVAGDENGDGDGDPAAVINVIILLQLISFFEVNFFLILICTKTQRFSGCCRQAV